MGQNRNEEDKRRARRLLHHSLDVGQFEDDSGGNNHQSKQVWIVQRVLEAAVVIIFPEVEILV